MFLISAAIILAVDDTNALLLNETSSVCVITSLDSKSLDTIFLVLKKGTVGLCVLMDRACLGFLQPFPPSNSPKCTIYYILLPPSKKFLPL